VDLADKAPAIITVSREDLLRVWPRINLRGVLITAFIAIIVYWSMVGTQASPGELIRGMPNIWDFIRKMFPPEWETQTKSAHSLLNMPFGLRLPNAGPFAREFEFPRIIYPMIETIQVAIIGTVFSIGLTAPFALLAARNIAPFPAIYQGTRLLLNMNRAIPEIIFALIFVVAVGLGPFAGVLALAVASIGFSAKIWAEAIEAIDPQQVLAVRATGASRLQTVTTAVMPQAMPLIASYSLISFEHNVRAATILGLVGAGGIGLELQKYLSLFQYQKLTGALIFMIIVVTCIDRVSDKLRKKLT
jgi:phosphonate transport system permease protein